MKLYDRVKSFVLRHARRSVTIFTIGGGGRRDPFRLDTRDNSVAEASVRWIQRNFGEAPLVVGVFDSKGKYQQRNDSNIRKLLKRPNDYYTFKNLWKGTLADYIYTGNAYWIKGRADVGGINGRGRVTSLWWIPSSMIKPVGDDNDPTIFIDRYEYTVDGQKYDIHTDDIVHFRDGFDPNNQMIGLSGFGAMLRELYSDNEAARMTANLLANAAVPGIVVVPGKDVTVDPDDALKIKADMEDRFTGENRGRPLVLTANVEVRMVGFTPEQLTLREIRKIPEERITAMIGVPAVVVGMGAGLERSTFANFEEARQAAYEGCLMCIQRDFADELNTQLLPEFHSDDSKWLLWFDITQVRVLQPDINALHVRSRGDLLVGGISLNEYRRETGRDELDNDVWYVPNGVTMMPEPGQGVAPTNPESVPDPNGNEPSPVKVLVGTSVVERVVLDSVLGGNGHGG